MEAFGPYMETLGTLVKTEKHGTELERRVYYDASTHNILCVDA